MINCLSLLGSSNGHSPVLNLSKSGLDQGSTGDQSDHSENPSPAPSIHDDENLSDNISDVDDREDKDEGNFKSFEYFIIIRRFKNYYGAKAFEKIL